MNALKVLPTFAQALRMTGASSSFKRIFMTMLRVRSFMYCSNECSWMDSFRWRVLLAVALGLLPACNFLGTRTGRVGPGQYQFGGSVQTLCFFAKRCRPLMT